MTVTYNEIVSRIQNVLNSVSKDMYIPKRLILSVFKTKAEFFLVQKIDSKKLFRENNLYKWINCIDMEEINSKKCDKVELQMCNTIMKTKNKLPKLIWTKFGSSVVMVTNMDGSKEYQLVTHSYYNSIRHNRNFDKFKGNFAILYPDNYIYIPDSQVRKINVLLYSFDEICDNLENCDDEFKDNCKSYWEKEFELMDKISEIVVSETIKEISMRLQIPKDSNDNLDPNIKSKEQQ